MKIDFDLLDRMEAAGASAKVIIAMLRTQFDAEEVKKVAKRPKDAKRQRDRRTATLSDTKRHQATPSDIERQAATLDDTPQARLYREGKPALLTLNISDNRAGGLITQWLKLTNDDHQLVLATILNAQSLAVSDAPSWILATLRGKTNGQQPRNSRSSNESAVLAGLSRGFGDRDGGLAGPAETEIPRGRYELDLEPTRRG